MAMESVEDNNTDSLKRRLSSLGIQEIQEDIFDVELNKCLGKGKNAVVYKIILGKLKCAAKAMTLYFDTPIFAKFTETEIISQTNVNDIVISYYIGKLKVNNISFPYLCGYGAQNQSLLLLKEYANYCLRELLTKVKNQEIITSILIRFIIIIYLGFQKYYKGYHFDLKVDNILVNKTNEEFLPYPFKENTYNLKTMGYYPLLSDFGSSVIIEMENKPILIKRHTEWKKKGRATPNNFLNISNKIEDMNLKEIQAQKFFDKSYDLFKLFNSLRRETMLQGNWLIAEYFSLLRTEFGFTNAKDYKPNSLTIKKFLTSPRIKGWLELNDKKEKLP